MGSKCFKVEYEHVPQSYPTTNCFFDLKATDITGKRIDFYIYRNRKAILVVNVASSCSLTDSNYKQLVHMYNKFKAQSFEILAFPCNQFDQAQPCDNEDIRKFVHEKYGVRFPMFDKVCINGPQTHQVYKYLRTYGQLTKRNDEIKIIPSNFAIFLIDRYGHVLNYFKPSKDLTMVEQWVQKTLQQTSDSKIQYY